MSCRSSRPAASAKKLAGKVAEGINPAQQRRTTRQALTFGELYRECLSVPSINDTDRTLLEADIAKNGLYEEILLTPDGMLLDGRNRLIACFKGHIEPRFRKVQSEPWGLAYSQNIARRHLDTLDKCKFAEAWAADEKEKAKDRESKGRPTRCIVAASSSVPATGVGRAAWH